MFPQWQLPWMSIEQASDGGSQRVTSKASAQRHRHATYFGLYRICDEARFMRLMMHAGNLFIRWNALTGKLHLGLQCDRQHGHPALRVLSHDPSRGIEIALHTEPVFGCDRETRACGSLKGTQRMLPQDRLRQRPTLAGHDMW